MKQTLQFWLHRLQERAKTAATEFRGDALWLAGKEKHSGQALSIFYYGSLMSYDFIVGSVYSEHAIQREQENVSVRLGARLLKQECACDVVIGDLAWPYYHALSRSEFLRLPPQIAHKLELPSDWAAIEQRFLSRKSTKDELRKLEKYGLSYRTTRDRGALERFYDTMYIPYARQRHAALLDVDPRELVVKIGTMGALLEIMDGERVVAGGILQRVDQRMRFLWLGIVGGLDAGLQGAAGAALYCFAIKHSISAGCNELDLMYSPANLDNGIHRYKRKLGSRVCNDWPYGQLLVKVARLTPAVVSLFAHMPIAATSADNALHGRITVDQDRLSPDDVRRMGSYYACAGLEQLKIFSARPLGDDVLRMDYAALDGSLPPLELYDLTRSANPAAEFCRS